MMIKPMWTNPNKHHRFLRRLQVATLLFTSLNIGLTPSVALAARPKMSDIQVGAYKPANSPGKYLSKSQRRERLTAYQAGNMERLAKHLLARSYGDALDYFYLATIAKNSGWPSTTRAYARLAAISFAAEVGESVDGLYKRVSFPQGCGRVSAEFCPMPSLGLSIIELNAKLDSIDAWVAQAVPLSLPDSFPSAAEIKDAYGRNLIHWYPDGRKIWVAAGTRESFRFMILDVPLGSAQIAVPRFEASTLVRVKTPTSSWDFLAREIDNPSKIFSYNDAIGAAHSELEKILARVDSTSSTSSVVELLGVFDVRRRELSELRSRVEGWYSDNPKDQELTTGLVSSIDVAASRVAAERRAKLVRIGEVERPLSEILEIHDFLRRTGEDRGLLAGRCVGSAGACSSVMQALNLEPDDNGDYPYQLFVSPGRERKSQSVIEQNIVLSSYVIGTQQVRNPAYQNLQMEYQNAMLAVEAARAEKVRADYNAAVNPGFMSGFIQGSAWGALLRAQARVEEISAALNQTEPLIQEERLSPYEYSEDKVKALYRQEFGVLLTHKKSKSNNAARIVIEDEKLFTISNGRSSSDKSGRSYAKGGDIVSWLEKPRSLSQSKILGADWKRVSVATVGGRPDYAGAARKLVAINDGESLNSRDSSNDDRVSPVSDLRLQSVVLVRTSSSVGAGFFVSKRNILTNAHVVGAETSVEIRLSDGRTALGRVIAVDEARDLALLRADIDGRPSVLIKDAGQVRPGTTVDVIGHPQGLEFSFSRGVISAIRRDFKQAGGIDVIQTDSAINPGNSGGPMYVGNFVVGIVTFKRGLSEGLGFAVHKDEIQSFLREAFTQ
jgi:S1-C subfamily serine protease